MPLVSWHIYSPIGTGAWQAIGSGVGRWLGASGKPAHRQEQDYLARMLKQATKAAKMAVREDKRMNAESLAQQGERASENGDARQIYNIINTLAPKARASTTTVRKNGKACFGDEEDMHARSSALQEIFEA